MKFNLRNYPNPTKLIQLGMEERSGGVSVGFKNKKINNPLSLPQIINELNNNNLLNIPIIKEVPIIFEDFNWFGKLKAIVKNFISRTFKQENFESSVAHYDTEQKSIHIFNGIIEPKLKDPNISKSYDKLLNSISSPSFLINFFVLHEIGHAIHENIRDNKTYNNFTDYFKGNLNNKIYQEQALISRENFADMFAAISLVHLDKNNVTLVNDLEAFIQFRKDIHQEKYYTFNGLDKLLSDVKNNNLNFSTAEDILNYISKNTDKELKFRLNESLQKIKNSQEHNKQLGFFSKCFNLDNYTFKEIVKFLEEKIGYQKPDSVIEEKDSFEQGKILYQKNSISNIVKKIKRFCFSFISEEENEKNTFKPK